MSPVPSYADLGKDAKDLLSKDYPTGSAKLELNTTTASGVVSAFLTYICAHQWERAFLRLSTRKWTTESDSVGWQGQQVRLHRLWAQIQILWQEIW